MTVAPSQASEAARDQTAWEERRMVGVVQVGGGGRRRGQREKKGEKEGREWNERRGGEPGGLGVQRARDRESWGLRLRNEERGRS